MQHIRLLNSDFTIHPGPVGIAFSGGADSSMLLYLLLTLKSDTIHVFTCASQTRQFSQSNQAKRVLDFLLSKLEKTNAVHHIYYVQKKNRSTIFTTILNLAQDLKLNTVYTAGTSFPNEQDLKSFNFKSEHNPTVLYQRRDPLEQRNLYNGIFYSPWWNFNKKFVADLYTHFDLLNDLFPMTRSCEHPQILTGHCAECWFCAERFWAFNTL